MSSEQLKSTIEEILNKPVQWVDNSLPLTIAVDTNDLVRTCQTLWTNSKAYFDQLSCITGIDNGPEAGTIEIIYTLNSIPFNQSLQIKVSLSRINPEVETVTSIWKSAEWLERELFDMYGVQFLNHPDLRRILMPGDWEGHPLLKDYVEPETYRGISTKEN